jgi:PAS domain S-box-containing protein
MGDLMKDDNKTKKQLVHELTELCSQNAALKKSTTVIISAELAAEEARRYAESIVETVREPLLVLDADLKIISANRNFYRTFKVTPGETIGTFIYDLGNKQWDIPKLRELLEEVLPEKQAFDDFEVAHDFQDIGHKIMLLNAREIYRKDIGTKMILLAIEDITEHKRLEDLLTESEGRYRNVFETASDGIVLFEKREGKITHANQAVEKMLGFSLEESVGKKLQDIGIVDIDDFQTLMQILNEIGITNYTDVLIKTKSGQHIDTDIYLADRARLVQCNIRDISQRKRAGMELQLLMKSMINAFVVFEPAFDNAGNFINCRFVYINDAYERITGVKNEEVKGKTILEVWPETEPEWIRRYGEVTVTGVSQEFELYHDHTEKLYHCSVYRPWETRDRFCVVFEDITERKQAEEFLKESAKKYRLLADNVPDVIFVLDMNLNYTYVSPSIKTLSGYEPEEVLKQPSIETLTPSSWDLAMRTLSEIIELERSEHKDINLSRTLQLEMGRKDGTTVWVETKFSFIRDENQRMVGILGVTRDITERREAEEELKQSEERYRSVFENAQEGIFRTTPDGRIIMSNQALSKMFGYESPEEFMADITDVARQLYVNPEERRILKEMIEEHGFVNGYETQNYKKDGGIIWISLNMYAVRDKKGQIMHYEGMNEEITDRKQTVERMRKALGATVHAIAVTVETRDPYTAGHQRRVSDLARAIATEMNLPIDQIDGIRMAAAIHDLGKISVPTEILSRPTKLTNIEFSLIKTHSQSGYDILKDIDFPWPVARTVLEHHERMDGSGYPHGLKGDNILLESKILAVADVMESMASHRPYRPALGIEAALEEIEKNRGTLYDNAVADTCLRLFREKEFQFEGT